MKAAGDGIGGAGLSPNEARKRYHGLGPVAGGDSPYMQQQYFSLEALAERDAAQPFVTPTPPRAPAEEAEPPFDLAAFISHIRQKGQPLRQKALRRRDAAA